MQAFEHYNQTLEPDKNMDNQLFSRFASTIKNLTQSELEGSASLVEKLRIAKDGDLEVCYAPFEYINPQARVVIVGITPGRTQMLNAIAEAHKQLRSGASDQFALQAAKQTGAFSGAMRPNLVALLDCIGLNRWLKIGSCSELFGSAAQLVQTTSALRNPVFVKGENYNGTPNMVKHPLLRDQLLTNFAQDVKALPKAVFIPLGDKVAESLHFLCEKGLLDKHRILDGLPHPSGANAERIAYFLGRKKRSELSSKTNPEKLDSAKFEMLSKVQALA